MEAHHLGSNGSAKRRDVQRREMVSFKDAIHLGPCGVLDALIRQTDMMQQHDWCRWVGVVNAEFDVGENPIGVSMGDEHCPRHTSSSFSKLVTVNQCDSCFNRIKVENSPHVVKK